MPPTVGQFILFGDSITRQVFLQDGGNFNFGAALSDAYLRRLDIINRGFSGFNTSQALRAVPFIMPTPEQADVHLMTIFFGANDARLPNSPGGPAQDVPLEQYTENLKAIVSHPSIRAHKSLRLMLITPPPINEWESLAADENGRPSVRPVPARTASNAARYAKACREVGEALGVAVFDFWAFMLADVGYLPDDAALPGSIDEPRNEKLQSYLPDGLHLSSAGYRLLFRGLMSFIERHWIDQMPNRLPMLLPVWSDVEAWKEDKLAC